MLSLKSLRLPLRLFCRAKTDKKEELKAYLEIIKPKEIYQMIERSQHSTGRFLKELKQLVKVDTDPARIREIQQTLNKSIKYLQPHHLKEIIKLNADHSHPALRTLYKGVVNYLTNNLDAMPIEVLINTTYQMAKCNIKEHHLMKELETRILDDGVPLVFDLIRKLLFTYTHLDVGSATLFGRITRTIRLGYHQLEPHHLAEFAYHLSKVSENAKGGYGVFKIAEESISKHIHRLKFNELVTICGFMLTQNLGSNDFQLALEEQIFEKFPLSAELNMNHLKELLHSTSGYHFKYKSFALGQLLENETIKNVKFATLEQADIILWAWGRARRGNKELWESLEKFYIQKESLLNPRQLAFDYYSFTKAPHDCTQILNKLEEAFSLSDLLSTNKHYLLKFLQGMHHRRTYNAPLFLEVASALVQQMSQLSPREFINFLKVLNESDFDFQSPNIDSLKTLLKDFEPRLNPKLSTFKISDISQILYLWTKLNIPNSQEFCQKLMDQLEDVNSIPKQCFLKVVFSYIVKDQYVMAFQMIEILFKLRELGPIGYFFSPFEYPLLAYSVFTYYVKGRNPEGGRLQVDQEAMKEIKHYFFQLEPKSLNGFMEKIYVQTHELIKEYDSLVESKS